jgi:hypothetical protein
MQYSKQYFNYIVAISFIADESSQRKQQTCHWQTSSHNVVSSTPRHKLLAVPYNDPNVVNCPNIVNDPNVLNDHNIVNSSNVVKHPTIVNCPYKWAECSKLSNCCKWSKCCDF